MSGGYCHLQVLAKKMTVLYKLAKEQLSKQYHYDFGLRALKSVLVMAGELKRGSPDLSEVWQVFYTFSKQNLFLKFCLLFQTYFGHVRKYRVLCDMSLCKLSWKA